MRAGYIARMDAKRGQLFLQLSRMNRAGLHGPGESPRCIGAREEIGNTDSTYGLGRVACDPVHDMGPQSVLAEDVPDCLDLPRGAGNGPDPTKMGIGLDEAKDSMLIRS